jgi:hypothetical protein
MLFFTNGMDAITNALNLLLSFLVSLTTLIVNFLISILQLILGFVQSIADAV